MEQRDLIKDQIEQLGKVLAKIMSDFLRVKTEGKADEGMTIANERFQDQLDLDLNHLLALDPSALKDCLLERQLAESHIEILSEYLGEVGVGQMATDPEAARKALTQAIELLHIAEEISKTRSFSRMDRKRKLEELLHQTK